MYRLWLVTGALSMLSALAIAAATGHALKGEFVPVVRQILDTAREMHFVHSLALIAVGIISAQFGRKLLIDLADVLLAFGVNPLRSSNEQLRAPRLHHPLDDAPVREPHDVSATRLVREVLHHGGLGAVLTEDLLEEAETNFEKADLEHWRVNGIAKADSKKLRVPLRLRQKAEQALAEWKIADFATRKLNPVCAGYLTAREKMGWKK
jgi:hypothetical protein